MFRRPMTAPLSAAVAALAAGAFLGILAALVAMPGAARASPPAGGAGAPQLASTPGGAPAQTAPAQTAAHQTAVPQAAAPQTTAQTTPAQAAAQPVAAPQTTAAASPGDGAGDAIRFMIERQVTGGRPGSDHRVVVQVGQLDPRLQLAPCARMEPYLPAGARLWGRTSIGVRCVEGARWATLVPVTVSVFGQAVVAAVPLAAGSPVGAADVRIEEVDLTREPSPPVADVSQLEGRVLTRALAPGQPVRQDQLRLPPVVSAGDPIRIRLVGQGFTVTGEGTAMAAAAEGQTLRVRTESGRIVVGQVRDRVLELKL